jgi:hypothetical protein
MKYKDPAPITCPKCGAKSQYLVADLLGLNARCSTCDEPLVQIGMEMRERLDEWASYVAKMLMQIRLEEHLGVSFGDEDIGIGSRRWETGPT